MRHGEISEDGQPDIYFNYSSDYGANWQAGNIRLDVGDTAGASDSVYPQIGSDDSGYVYVTWYDERAGSSDIYFYYSNNYGATWQVSDTRLDIGDSSGSSGSLWPEMTSDNTGHIYVTWYDQRDGGPDIYFDALSNPTANNNVIPTGGNWKYFKGFSNPGAGWNDISFDDSAWLEGPSGIGMGNNSLGDADDATVLSDMQNNYLTVYARQTFNVTDASAVAGMILSMDYDDGFVAYINGQEVARANMPGGTPDYNTNASGTHEAGTPEAFDLGSYTGNLVTGTNVLTIEIHNNSIGDGKLSMIPVLDIEVATGSDPTQTTTNINTEDNWKYFKGYSNPGAGWDDISFDDSAWLEAPSGIGFGDGDDATVLSDMQNNYLTVYARKTFTINDASVVTGMTTHYGL